MRALTKRDILALFALLNEALGELDVAGELYLVGGAVMCLVHEARESTQDVDAYFKPSQIIRQAAARVATTMSVADDVSDIVLSQDWLNDAVKGFLSEHGAFADFMELSHLKVYAASPEYLLAMKCLAARIGEEFHDIDDIRYLLRHLDLRSYEAAITIISAYYPIARFPQKTHYLLQELLPA